MRIERVTQNQIKITLSNQDMKEWDISVERLTKHPDETRALIWSILQQAEAEEGFLAEGAQLMVEAMHKNDGFAMMVTRLEDGDADVRPRLRREARIRRKKPPESLLIYCFDRFDVMLGACGAIENHFVGHSKLYKHQEQYYLVLDVVNEFLSVDLALMLSEYGDKMPDSAVFRGYLGEYGRELISEGAVAILVSYFDR